MIEVEIGFVAEQPFFIIADQLLDLRTVMAMGRGEGGLADEFRIAINPDVTFITELPCTSLFVRSGVGVDL